MLAFTTVSGQLQEVPQLSFFGSRINNPIEVKVLQRSGGYAFVATNRSFYCYQLEISFSYLENLTPFITTKKMTVYQGRTELFKLDIVDTERRPYFEYSWKYSIGVPGGDIDYSYPYLVPLKNSFGYYYFSNPDPSSDSTAQSSPYYIYLKGPRYNDTFVPRGNDTVYCMRKGYVAATPTLYNESDRLSGDKTLEIIHDDGSVMIYLNMRDDTSFVSAGAVVYPGQPLGIVKQGMGVTANLYEMIGDGHVKRVEINYYNGEQEPVTFESLKPDRLAEWPEELILREMSKREQRKFKSAGSR